jgi:type VI secretion system protein VasD
LAKRGIILLFLVLMLSGCGLFGKKEEPPPPPPPPPEPTRVIIEFEATGDINPNSEGRPSPLYLRIYQLKGYAVFESADFFSLYDRGDEILGRDLVAKEEILLKPNEKRTVFYEVADDTGAIGLLGLFMDYENVRWKAVAGVQANKTTVIRTLVSQAGLTIR